MIWTHTVERIKHVNGKTMTLMDYRGIHSQGCFCCGENHHLLSGCLRLRDGTALGLRICHRCFRNGPWVASLGMRSLAMRYREATERSELAGVCATNAELLADRLKESAYWTCE
jgi:hypothetical protein